LLQVADARQRSDQLPDTHSERSETSLTELSVTTGQSPLGASPARR
jgi:hypothetical protein